MIILIMILMMILVKMKMIMKVTKRIALILVYEMSMFTCAFKFFSSDDNPAFGQPVGQLLLGEDCSFVWWKSQVRKLKICLLPYWK